MSTEQDPRKETGGLPGAMQGVEAGPVVRPDESPRADGVSTEGIAAVDAASADLPEGAVVPSLAMPLSVPLEAEPPPPVFPGRWERGRWVEGEGAAAGRVTLPASALHEEPVETSEARLHVRGIRLPIWWEAGLYTGIFIIGLVLRLWDLGIRAVHHDESLHGYFAYQIFTGAGYHHNPLTHGMFFFDAMAAAFFLFGDNDFTLRLAEALFGAALVLMPLLLRHRLGVVGAVAASVMIAISPSLLYFSRFAREDIFMAVFVLGVIAMVWRYLDEGKNRYLYGAAAFLALAFTTKETSYIAAAIVGASLLVFSLAEVGKWVWGRMSMREWSRPASAMLVVGALTLPMFAAGIGFLIQELSGLTLTAAQNTPGVAPGAPARGGYVVAFAITLSLIVISMVLGLVWNRRTWLIAFGVFWGIFILIFSNFLTYPEGVATGIWQSLGYWIAQHSERRGDQPWYYYFILVHVYEFLPWLLAVGTVLYFAVVKRGAFLLLLAAWAALAAVIGFALGTSAPWMVMGVLLLGTIPFVKADRFVRFIIFWGGSSFLAFSIAGEKMPWLVVHIALPLIVLAARSINDLANTIDWRKAWSTRAWLAIPGTLLFLLLLYRLIVTDDWRDSFWMLWAILALLGILLVGLHALATRVTWKGALSFCALVTVGVMGLLTLRASMVASFESRDVPREMLVYTQTSPMLHSLVGEIEQVGVVTGEREAVRVSIDSTSGFTWPWAWYLRRYTGVSYLDYSATGSDATQGAKVVVVHRNNNADEQQALAETYYPGRQFPHRWWFPEDYRNLTFGKFIGTFTRPNSWKTFIDYFLYRKLPNPLGSEDAHVYFSKELPLRPFQ